MRKEREVSDAIVAMRELRKAELEKEAEAAKTFMESKV